VEKKILKINPSLLWDVDITKFDFKKGRELVIERVFFLGALDDFKEILSYYGIKKIKNSIKNIAFLDKKTLSFASWYLKIPKKEFKCYQKARLNKIHWSL
jgi:hypothetical protein